MRKHTIILILGFLAASSLLAEQPLQQRDQWQLEDTAAWKWQGEGDATTLVLKKPSQYKPKVRRPFNLAWFGGAEFGSFTLTCEARLDVFNKGNNDVCVAFGGRGESEFYYAHLGETADGVHLQVHVVNQADRKAITTNRAKALPWKPDHWHPIKLVRDASSGSIQVWFEDQLVLEASDTTFGKGRIGFGSFDDLGAFRKVTITSAAESVQQIEVVAGGGTLVENAPATQCKVTQPFGIAFDPQDNMFICEETHRLLRVDAKTGALTVVTAAKGKNAPAGDNGPAKDASFIAPTISSRMRRGISSSRTPTTTPCAVWRPDFAVIALDYSAIMEQSIAWIGSKDREFKETRGSVHAKRDKVFDETVDRLSYDIAWIGEPAELNVRVDRQAGTFLVSGNRGKKIEEALAAPIYETIQMTKFTIKASLYESVFVLLRKMNINSKSLYGDLNGLAKAIRMEMQMYAMPR